MENNKEYKGKRIIIIALASLLLSVIGNGIFILSNSSLKKEKDKAVLKMDSLLSVKLLIDKELDNAKKQLASSNLKNVELDQAVADLISKLNQNKKEIEKLLKDNASVGVLRKKLKDSQKLGKDCQKVVNDYIRDVNKMEADLNTCKQNSNKLLQENEDLKKKLELAKTLKAYDIVVINYKISGRSPKPTIKAKKVNRVSATFNLAENQLADPGSKEIHMIVYDSKGIILETKAEIFFNKTTGKEQVYSVSKMIDYKNSETKVSVNFDYDQKMLKGKHRFEIYTDGVLSGKKEFILK